MKEGQLNLNWGGCSTNKQKDNWPSVNDIWTNTFYTYAIQGKLLIKFIFAYGLEILFIIFAIIFPIIMQNNSPDYVISVIAIWSVLFVAIGVIGIFIFVFCIIYFIRILKIIDKFQFDANVSTFFKGIKVWSIVWFICFLLFFLTGISVIFGFIFLIISFNKSKSLLIDIQNRYELQYFYPPSFSSIEYIHNNVYDYYMRAENWLKKYYSLDDLNIKLYSDQKMYLSNLKKYWMEDEQELQIIRRIKKISFLGSLLCYVSWIFVGPSVLYLQTQLKSDSNQKKYFFKMSLLSTILIIIPWVAMFLNVAIYVRASRILSANETFISDKIN